MIELCSRDACTGCGACQNICPKACIEMVEDEEGFLFPSINHNKCISCNLCREVCPILSKNMVNYQHEINPKTFACWINDDAIRLRSSSGGIFSAIAINVLKKSGVVFGAAFDENMSLNHIAVEKIEDLEKLRRSKYIQSKIGNTLKQARDFLDSGRLVFFVGTPCQIAGLNQFLKKDYKNLITADFICHGVPSPGVFSEYVKYLESIEGDRLIDINFRDKRKGWSSGFFVKAKFKNGKTQNLSGYRNSFIYGFSKNYFLRKSCYDCKFKAMPRQADITLGDFWGIQNEYHKESFKGISCLLINSKKGNYIIDDLKKYATFNLESFLKVKKRNKNLYSSCSMPAEREYFFKDFNKVAFSVLIKKYLTPPLTIRIRVFIKNHLNFRVIYSIKKWINLIRRK